MSPALIAIDWGSSSFRAYLMSPGGEVLEEIASGDGIASVAAGAYPATLEAPRRALARREPLPAGDRVGHGRQSAWLARGALCPLPGRPARRRRAPDGGRGRRPAGRPRAGPVLRGRGRTVGRDAGRGDGNLRRRRRRRKAHRAAGLAFEMGQDRRRARRRVQDLHHRRTVRKRCATTPSPAPSPGRRRRRAPGRRSRSGSSAARRRRAARRSPDSSASCSARARCR